METNTNTESGDLMTTLVLWISAGCCYVMTRLIPMMDVSHYIGTALDWTLAGLSIVSVIFVIAVNWKKGIAQMKEWKSSIKKWFK